MRRKIILSLCSLVLVPFLTGESQAQIYKCTNSNNKIVYNDKPCPVKDKEQEFNAVKDPVNGYIPPTYVELDSNQINENGVSINNTSLLNNSNGKSPLKKEYQNINNERKNSQGLSSGANNSNEDNESVNNNYKVDSSANVDYIETNDSNEELKVINLEPIATKEK